MTLALIILAIGFMNVEQVNAFKSSPFAQKEANPEENEGPEQKPEPDPNPNPEPDPKPNPDPPPNPEPSPKPDPKPKPEKPKVPEKPSKPTKPSNSENSNKSSNSSAGSKSGNNHSNTQSRTPSPTPQPQPRTSPTPNQGAGQTEPLETEQTPISDEPEDEGALDLEEDEESEGKEEKEADDEELSIEELKEIDIMVKKESGKFYVIYQDEDNNIVKREITQEEAAELGYEDELAELENEQVDHVELTSNETNGAFRKLFGIISVVIVSIGLIGGTYLYYRRKIA